MSVILHRLQSPDRTGAPMPVTKGEARYMKQHIATLRQCLDLSADGLAENDRIRHRAFPKR